MEDAAGREGILQQALETVEAGWMTCVVSGTCKKFVCRIESCYAARVGAVMISGADYFARDLHLLCGVRQDKVYMAMKTLVGSGFAETVEPEPVDYPESWDFFSKNARKNWRVRNGVPRRGNMMMWRRVG